MKPRKHKSRFWKSHTREWETKGAETFLDAGWVETEGTGLKDCRGTEIYEGDIVRSTRQHGEKTLNGKLPSRIKAIRKMFGQSRILWDDGGFIIKKRGKRGSQNRMCSVVVRFLKLEVVGNVFENPELLRRDVPKKGD